MLNKSDRTDPSNFIHEGFIIRLVTCQVIVFCRLQPTAPLALNSKDEVDMFFDGTLPKLAKTATDIAVVGMFLDKNDKGNCFKPVTVR